MKQHKTIKSVRAMRAHRERKMLKGGASANGRLLFFRDQYRNQHEAMMGPGGATQTTRRQKAFRPRGSVYVRLLKLELKW